MNFLYQAFAELLLRVGSVGADASVACAVGSQEEKNLSNRDDFPMLPGCSLH